MSENSENPLKKPPKLDTIGKAIVQIKQKNPSFSVSKIANKIRDIGLIKSRTTVYRRYNRSDYLQREFAEVQAHEDERLLRQTGPRAVDQIDLILTKGKVKRGPGKYEEVDVRTIADTAKHVTKHHWGERQRSPQSSGVSVGAIKNAQITIMNAIQRGDSDEPSVTDVIDIEVNAE